MSEKIKIVYSPKCLAYEEPGHPESPERVASTALYLEEKGFEFVRPGLCKDEDILAVHAKKLLEQVRKGEIFDPDTPALANIYTFARLSAGGAIKAAEFALSGEASFSLMRPPGHHAGKDFLGGFCYFNNLAIAVKTSLQKVKKVAILDVDCHHGNGTQDIFLGDPNILYVSLHQSPFYPGTGLTSEFNAINFPLPAGTGEKKYLEKLDIGLRKIYEFSPELLAISAGFDTYKKDPLTLFGLEMESFRKIGQRIKKLASPTFAVLEGGYSKNLPLCIYNFLKGLGV